MAVEVLHQNPGSGNGDRVAHRYNHLHSGPHQVAAQAGFAVTLDVGNLLARLTGVQKAHRNLFPGQQISQFRSFNQIALPFGVAFQNQKRFEAVIFDQVRSPVAGFQFHWPVVTLRQPFFIRFFQGVKTAQHTMGVKMDDVVIARAFFLQVVRQAFKRSRTQQLNVNRQFGIPNGFKERSGNGPIPNIVFLIRARHHHQHVEPGGWIHLGWNG